MALFSSAIAAATAWIGSLTWAAVGMFALKTAASIGLSALAQKLSGKKDAGQQSFGIKGTLERGADIPQSFIMGKYATAGSLTYANTYFEGSPNYGLAMAITLSDLPISALTGIWINGVRYTLIPYSGVLRPSGGYFTNNTAYLTARFYDGTQTLADPLLANFASSAARPWTSTAVGKGKAYVVIRAYSDPHFWRNGFPQMLFEVDGIKLYNPAKDTSVGGVGAHRWADPTTWESSENPAVQLYNLLRGIRYNGVWFYGLQDVAEAQLPAAHWIAQINKCDSTILGASGPEPLFRSSCEIPVNAEIHSVIESLLDTCNGRLSDAGGVYKLFAGAPDAPVMSFSDDDILSTSEQSFTPFLGLSDTVNGVAAKYPSRAAGWQIETAPPLYRPDYEAEDGGRRLLVDISLDFVPYAEQAQRLMLAALNEARRARRHTFTLPPKYWPLEPGDVVSWTSVRNGYAAKQFRVDGVIDLPNADVIVDLTEVDPADYDFDTATDFTPPVVPSNLPQPVASQSVGGFTVTASSIEDAAAIGRRPAIKVEWDGTIPDVAAVKFDLRIKATGAPVDPARADTVSDGEIYISSGILAATEYEVRAKFIPISPRPTDWTAWVSVTTLNLLFVEADLNPGSVTTEVIAPAAVNVSRMFIDNQLELDAVKAGFVMGKDGAYNLVDDGIYMGRTEEPGGTLGFGFSVSKTSVGGAVQSLSATYEDGLRITNANFYRDLDVTPAPVTYTTSQTISLGAGATLLSLTMQGAGGGGKGGAGGNDGTAGGATTVELKDGATTIATWAAPGGAGATGVATGQGAGPGQSSPWGAGGQPTLAAGNPGSGRGAGGAGGYSARFSSKGGLGGLAGAHISFNNYDVSALTDPKIVITIGASGLGGAGSPGNGFFGGNGSAGRIDSLVVDTRPVAADVIPLTPTTIGLMNNSGPFPDLGAGLWVLSAAAQTNITLGTIEVAPGASVYAVYGQVATFISSQTPVITSGWAYNHAVTYLFYKMGA